MKTRTRSNASGFTLAELLIVVGIVGVSMVGATVVLPSVLKQSRADGSAGIVANTMRLARDRAIGERRNMDVVFVPPDRIKIVREEITYNSVTGTWSSTYGLVTNPTVMDVRLEGNQRFLYFAAMTAFPPAISDTGDQFGLTNKPLAFGTIAAAVPTIMFTSEGTLVDVNGDPTNGTIFLGTGDDITSARAVTIFGATGLVRHWKWDGRKWAE
jgi:prepilin-type N-terminal cleavage/methylation domain-containing protein